MTELGRVSGGTNAVAPLALPDAGAAAVQEEDEEVEVLEWDPSERYGRYKDVLGRGSFKTVYRGFDEIEGMEVAWNQMRVSGLPSEMRHRLLREVQILERLSHPNIIRLYKVWLSIVGGERMINFITESCSSSLRSYIRKHRDVHLSAIKSWARQILRGLDYLHNFDPPVIHRDLKSDNVFMNTNSGEIKLGDLGLAAFIDKQREGYAQSVIGTPEFMAPELYDEHYDTRVDIYSFGMCVLELITREYPYRECENPAQIYKKVMQGVRPEALNRIDNKLGTHLGGEAERFIRRCIGPLEERPSAGELLQDSFLMKHPDASNLALRADGNGNESAASLTSVASDTSLADTHSNISAAGSSIAVQPTEMLPQHMTNDTRNNSHAATISETVANTTPNARSNDEHTAQKPFNALDASDRRSEPREQMQTDTTPADAPNRLAEPHSTVTTVASHRDEQSQQQEQQRSSAHGFNLKGKRVGDQSVKLKLRIYDSSGHSRKCEFNFYCESDTPNAVAKELIEQLDLESNKTEPIAAEIAHEVSECMPGYRTEGGQLVAAEEHNKNTGNEQGVEQGVLTGNTFQPLAPSEVAPPSDNGACGMVHGSEHEQQYDHFSDHEQLYAHEDQVASKEVEASTDTTPAPCSATTTHVASSSAGSSYDHEQQLVHVRNGFDTSDAWETHVGVQRSESSLPSTIQQHQRKGMRQHEQQMSKHDTAAASSRGLQRTLSLGHESTESARWESEYYPNTSAAFASAAETPALKQSASSASLNVSGHHSTQAGEDRKHKIEELEAKFVNNLEHTKQRAQASTARAGHKHGATDR